MTTRHAMAIGTAGYTAALCVDALEAQGVTPDDGDILVTGASGGVGSVAVALLAARGFSVAASTGKPDAANYLKRLGASSIVDRNTLSEAGKPLKPSSGLGWLMLSAVIRWPMPVLKRATGCCHCLWSCRERRSACYGDAVHFAQRHLTRCR